MSKPLKTVIKRIDNSTNKWRFYEEVREDGEQLWCYPSVTSKISAVYPTDTYLVKWIREQGIGGQAIFEKAGDEGTEAHIAIDTLIRGDSVCTLEMPDKVKRCVKAFLDWVEEFNPIFLESEKMVVNHEYNFAGTRDLLCELDYEKGKNKYKGVYCIDYKTSSGVHDSHRIQNAAYWSCGKKSTDRTAILHLGNRTKAKYSFLEYDPLEYWEQFKHFNKTFDILNPNARPNFVKYPDFFKLNL